MNNSLSEQVADLEADHARLGQKMLRLEAERNDLQRQVQEARDEAAELRAGQGRWPGDRDDRLTDSEQQQISTYLRMVSHSFFNPARYRRRDGTFEDAIIEQLDAEVAQWRNPEPETTATRLTATDGTMWEVSVRAVNDATLTTPEAQ